MSPFIFLTSFQTFNRATEPFLENETIKLLRTFHTISSRKGNIPPLEIFVNHEISKFEFDAKNNCCYIGLSPETINKICNKEISMLISRGIDTESLRGNYVVSRFLVKIFIKLLGIMITMDFILIRHHLKGISK